MIHHTGHVKINVYQRVTCVRENVQKVTRNVVRSVFSLVKCKTTILAIHSVFLMTFTKSIGGLVMVNAYQIEICVMGNAMKVSKNVVATLAYLLRKYRTIKSVTKLVITNPVTTDTSGVAMGVADL